LTMIVTGKARKEPKPNRKKRKKNSSAIASGCRDFVQVSFLYNRSLTPIPGLFIPILGLDIRVDRERERLLVPAARAGLVYKYT